VVSGRAGELGIEAKCRGEDIAIGDAGVGDHLAACHLVPLGEKP
jgi:hypothetical protein